MKKVKNKAGRRLVTKKKRRLPPRVELHRGLIGDGRCTMTTRGESHRTGSTVLMHARLRVCLAECIGISEFGERTWVCELKEVV